MKTLRGFVLVAISAMGVHVQCQDWHQNFPLGNSVNVATEYLGCDATSTESLKLKTLPDLEIQMHTSDIERFTLLPDNTYTVGGSSVIADGFSLHSPDVAAFYAGGAPGPYSLEHLAAATNSAYQAAYRNWARTGTTYTGGGSMAYVGLKDGDVSHTDLAIQLAKREGSTAPDRIRFLFTDVLNGGSTAGADSQEGLEGMRLTAVGNDDVNVGLGDFFAAGAGEPAERLDLVDGKVRIRQLPTDIVSTSDEMVVVNMTTGVLEHKPFPSSTDCDWVLDPDPTDRYMFTGTAPVSGTDPCPDRGWLYGIGTSTPAYKLDLFHDDVNRLVTGGMRSEFVVNNAGTTASGLQAVVRHASASTAYAAGYGLRGHVVNAITGVGVEGKASVNNANVSAGLAHGVLGEVSHIAGTIGNGYGVYGQIVTSGTSGNIHGVYGNAYGSGNASTTSMHGVYGRVLLYGGQAFLAYGVRGLSYPGSGGTITNNYGVHGRAFGGTNNYSIYGALPTGGSLNWSGFFEGAISASGMSFPSDQALKSDVQDLEDPLTLLAQLQPKSYSYRREEYPQMGLPEGLRYGFIAQEVQEVFPQFVTPSHQPQHLDSLGNETSAAVDYLALSTMDIIPIVVAAVQEQQQTISEVTASVAQEASEMQDLRNLVEEQRTRLDQMEQLLAECCNRPAPDGLREGGINNVPELHDTNGDRKLRIQPNPFSESTTVFYMLERSGRAQLMANSADGKQLRVLQEANLESGSYQYEWNTADLAAGIYYVTLLLDGQPVVKKAVKVDR